MKKNTSISRFLRDQRGANLVEYIMLVGLVALLALGGYKSFGEKVKAKVTEQSGTIGTSINGTAGTGP